METHECEGEVALRYVGDGMFIPGVPTADITVPCEESHRLIETGLYILAATEAADAPALPEEGLL